jgi:hypothetical protein
MLETAVGPSATTPLAITPVPPAGDETIACLADWEHADSTIEASKIMQIRLRTGFRPILQMRVIESTPHKHNANTVSNDLRKPKVSLRDWLP